MANLDKAEIGKNIQIFLNEMKKFESFAKLEGIKGTKSSAGRTVEGSKKILKLFFPFAGSHKKNCPRKTYRKRFF